MTSSLGAALGLDPLPSSFSHAESSVEHQIHAGVVVVVMNVDDSNGEVSGLLHDRLRRFPEADISDSNGSGTETLTSVSDGLREDLPDRQENVTFSSPPGRILVVGDS